MRITRQTMAIGFVAVSLIAGLSAVLYQDSSQLNLLTKERLIEKEILFDELYKMTFNPIEKMVRDYSYWDDLFNYVLAPEDRWAKDNLDTSFATYNYHYLWIYRNDGTLVRSMRNEVTGPRPGSPFPLPMNDIKSLVDRGNNFAQFHVMTPQGVMAVFVAPIRSPLGHSPRGRSFGLLLAGTLIDQNHLRELSRLSRSTISLQESKEATADTTSDPRDGVMTFSRALTGLHGETVKTLLVRMPVADVQRLLQEKDKNAVTGTVLIALLYCLAGFILHSRQRLKRAKLNLDAAQRVSRMGSWQLDIEQGVFFGSDNLYDIFGLSKSGKSIALEDFYALVHPEDLPRIRASIEHAIASKDGFDVECRVFRGDGELRTMRSRGVFLLVDGLRRQIAGYTQDVTELARMTSELVALNKHKDEMVTMLGHDLRTPLTPLTTILPLVRDRVADTELKKMVDLCCKSTVSLTKVVEKSRKLFKLFASVNEAELVPTPLASAVDAGITCNAGIIAEKQVACLNEVDPSIVLNGIPSQLSELFANLISNAVRFSPENGIVRISAERLDKTVTVAVHDDGFGLAQEHLERIFDEFFKADVSRHDLESPGLGLAICKRIVLNHNGRIWAESPGLGMGTTIRFTIREFGG